MLGNDPYYHGVIRKVIISFGNVFSDIVIERQGPDNKRAQSVKVPIAYGPKEKWLRHLQENPDLSKTIKYDAPRIAFEITNYTYDPARKLGANANYMNDSNNNRISTPTPWNLDISLYVLTRFQDDMLNILEQVFPFFSPGIVMKIKVTDNPVSIIDVPVVLNTVQLEDNWDENFDESRIIVSQLNFTVKTYLFGPVLTPKIIKHSISNVSVNNTGKVNETYNAVLDPIETETINDDFTIEEYWDIKS
jgi:hypothetical protein